MEITRQLLTDIIAECDAIIYRGDSADAMKFNHLKEACKSVRQYMHDLERAAAPKRRRSIRDVPGQSALEDVLA